MIEAVGEEHWPSYFKTVHDRLKPGGTAAIQAITIDEHDFDDYRSGPDFIQRFIFPGGMLLTKTAMKEQAASASGWCSKTVETFRLSYAKTLALWRDRFLERWPRSRRSATTRIPPQVDLLPELLRSRFRRRLDRRRHLPVPPPGLTLKTATSAQHPQKS